MSRIGLGLVLVAVWLLWWGSASPANVLAGIAVVLVLFVVFPSDRAIRPTIRFRPIALARLLGFFAFNLVTSNVVLSRTILSPRADVHTGVVKVPLRTDDVGIITMVANITALTPGSMVVQLDVDGSDDLAWVHVLTPGDPFQVARSFSRLEQLCVEAVGSDEQIARLRTGSGGAHGPMEPTEDEPS